MNVVIGNGEMPKGIRVNSMINRILVLMCFTIIGGCVTSNRSISPAEELQINEHVIGTKKAREIFRESLVNILSETPIENVVPPAMTLEARFIHRNFPPTNYIGAKSSSDKRSVFFLYDSPALGSSYFTQSAIFADIDRGASMRMFKIPENIWGGLVTTVYESRYALVVSKSSICRATTINNVLFDNGSWSYELQKGVSASACYGKTSGSIPGALSLVSLTTSLSLSKTLGADYQKNYLVIEHNDVNKLMDLSNILKSAFIGDS